MRVLHISAGNMYGGVETLLVTLARYRDLSPGMDPSFALCFDGRLSSELAETGVPVHRLGEVKISQFWTMKRARQVLQRLFREHHFDVVVAHMSWSHFIFGPEIRRARLPLVNWGHTNPTGHSWLEQLARRTPPQLAICNSRFTASRVHLQFGKVPAEVVYYPVALPAGEGPDRYSARKQLGIPEDKVVILQVSRMEAWKGHSLHLDALANLSDLDNWICLMAGGAQRPQEERYLAGLKRQAENLGISKRVRFLGQRSDVPTLLAAADIFCQPNQGPEPFGIVFIEALSTGLPVVSTNIGGAAEILDRSCGILTPAHDPTALAAALRRLIESPSERGALGAGGPRRARALCDPAVQLATLHQTLERVAHGQ